MASHAMNLLRYGSIVLALAVTAACSSESEPDTTGSGGSSGTNPGAGTGSGNAGKGGTAGSSGAGGAGGAIAGASAGGAAGSATAGTGASSAGETTTGGTGATGTVGGAAGAAGLGSGGGAGDTTGNAGMGGTAAGAAGGSGSAGAPPEVDEPELVTSAQNAYWQVGTLTETTSGNAEVTVNDGMALQTWSGFGGTFNEKGWEALSALSEADRAAAIKLLFDKVDGANFVYGRIPIGASDYATSRYTLNDTAGDTAMTNFSIERDLERLIPYIKAAQAVKPDIHFWGSPWTPPPWMKDNNAYDRGNMKDDNANLQAYALYLALFVERYGEQGITIEGIHPQNEPGYPQDYPSCLWTGALMAKFIGQFLGPTFEDRGVEAEIFIGTMSNPDTDGTVLTTVMNNATAKAFVKGYGLQWGMIDRYSSLNMDTSLQIWQTEHKCGNYPWVSGTDQSRAPNDHAYGVESWGLIRDWIKKGVNAYSAWNMVLDTIGRSLDTVRPWAQNALLAVDTSGKRLVITPTYYVFRHLSQYVDPGAQVVGTTGGDALAFKNPDGSIVAVLYNSGGAKMTTVALGGKKYQFDMPGNGWATVNVK